MYCHPALLTMPADLVKMTITRWDSLSLSSNINRVVYIQGVKINFYILNKGWGEMSKKCVLRNGKWVKGGGGIVNKRLRHLREFSPYCCVKNNEIKKIKIRWL